MYKNKDLTPFADFFWDVPLWRNRMTCSISTSNQFGSYRLALAPRAEGAWPTQYVQVDFAHGFVTKLSGINPNISVVMNYENLKEILPGVWMYTSHSRIVHFASDDQIVHNSIISSIQVNQDLPASLFTIPTE